MKIRLRMIAVLAVFALTLFVLIERKSMPAAAQSPAPAKTAAPSLPTSQSPTIPDTTLAINSPTPLSQRIVHYEIDAKYDASSAVTPAPARTDTG